jgi:hypothetical protein
MPAQTTRNAVTDDAGNKVLELRVALACLRCGSELELDDPDGQSKGTNPDVISRMPDGRRWGFACKVVHSDRPQTWAEAPPGI